MPAGPVMMPGDPTGAEYVAESEHEPVTSIAIAGKPSDIFLLAANCGATRRSVRSAENPHWPLDAGGAALRPPWRAANGSSRQEE
jgi:hypothetical protein